MLLTVLVNVAIPMVFLYFVHWLDLYGTDRPRILLTCVAWGMVAFLLSFVCNRLTMHALDVPRSWIGTHTAPIVEEIFKSLVLVHLVRRAKLTYFVDGAIYGFASGIGFAVIENLRYIQLYPDNPLGLVIVRGFTATLAHGTATALTGLALGSFVPSARGQRPVVPLLLGLTGAMTLHYLWNLFSFRSTYSQNFTEWVLVGVGLSGLTLVAAAILWGMRRERLLLRASLGMKVRVSEEEASVVQHMEDLDRLLAPIEKRFGATKRQHVADLLHLEAQLGMAEQLEEETTDPDLRAERQAQVAAIEQQLDRQRRDVGVYVMLYVRSIFPTTAWSLWARLGQTLAKRSSPRGNMWDALGRRIASNAVPGEGLYARTQVELDARAHAATLTMQHVHELPDALQKCLHWVIDEIHVTAQHAAAGLGHQESHAHEMLNDLAARGFLHRTTKDGQVAYRARAITQESRAARPHVWQALARRTTRHS